MQLLALSFLPAIISAAGIGSRLIGSKDANAVLSTGESRGFSGFIEEFRPSDLRRECVEEQCDYEEWLERAENDHVGIRKDAKLVTGPTASVRFTDYYMTCWDKVTMMNLDEPGLIDFRKECIQTFLRETFPHLFMPEETEEPTVAPQYDY